jgi:adenylate cyclase
MADDPSRPTPEAKAEASRSRRAARRRRYRQLVRVGIACLAALAGLLSLLDPSGLAELMELKILDWHAQLRGRIPPPPNITLVAIDEASLERIGRWPWPRTRTAEIIERLTEGGARVITLDLLMNEPDQNSRLVLARTLGSATGSTASAASHSTDFARLLGGPGGRRHRRPSPASSADAPGGHTYSSSSAGGAPAVTTTPSSPQPEPHRGLRQRQADRPGQTPGSCRSRFRRRRPAQARRVFPDRDGSLRASSWWSARRGPLHMTLETARLALGLSRARVQVTAAQDVLLGSRAVPTDENGLMHLSYYGPAGTFRPLSAGGVLTSPTPPPVDGHVVLVGFTAHGLMDVRPTPFDPNMPGVEIQATALANLMEGRGLRRLASLALVEAVAVLVLAALGPLVLPRLGPLGGTVVALAVGLAVFGVAHAGFRGGTWILLLPPLAALGVGHVGSVTYQVLTEERKRHEIKMAFRQYVPPAVVERLGRDPEALTFGGERKVLTVLFSDIRGFTTFSERHSPEEVVATLREYLSAMVDIVFRHRGTLDKFMGDAIMAFFGAPFENPEHALQACRAAVEMSQLLERLNEKWKAEGREPLGAGFGISTGEMLVGNLGSTQRFTYTVIGDQVNLCARLESLNKDYPTRRHIIMSEGTYAQVKDHVVARRSASPSRASSRPWRSTTWST